MLRTMETSFFFKERISAGQNRDFKVRNLLPKYALLQTVNSFMQ